MAKQVETGKAVKWNIKIPGEVDAAVETLAKREERTKTNMFIVLLRAALRKRGMRV